MARSRNIKPGFFLNDQLAECDPLARLLFAGLWCIADREGRLEDRPKRIKAEILPYDDCDIDQLLDQLAKHGFILRYEVEGERYIQIINFLKHQNPHKNEIKSVIPPPQEMHQTSPKISGVNQEMYQTNPADSLNLIPDSLNPHTDSKCIPEQSSEAPAEQPDKKSTKIKFADFVSLTNAEYEALVAKLGEEATKRCIEILDNYKGATGKKYKSDYRAILNWVVQRYEEEKRRNQQDKPKTNNPFLELAKEEGLL